jgi:hypothetical protein
MSPETAATNLPIVHLPYDTGKNIDYWLDDTDTVKLKNFGEKCPTTALSATSTKWTTLVTGLGL